MTGIIQLFHGSRRWEGRPEIRATPRGRGECGPGIYLTTHYERARKYSKGGGSVMRIDVRPRHLLDDVALSLDTARTIAEACVAKSKLKSLSAELETISERYMGHTFRHPVMLGQAGDQFLPASSLLNLCINDDLILGERGPRMAAQLAGLGIDAALHTPGGGEHWLVVFNPEAIVAVKKLPANSVALADYELPSPKEQLSAAPAPASASLSL